MSISSEISRIKTDKETLRQALVDKGATLTAGALLSDFSAAVEALPTGDSTATFGVIDAAGNFQPLDVTQAPPTTSGDASTVTVNVFKVSESDDGVVYPEVTVTAEAMRSGVTAIKSNGSVITGTMADVAITETPEKVTISAGYNPTAREFTVSGGGGGGSVGGEGGLNSFAKVTNYIAPYDAYSAVTSIQISGWGKVDVLGELVDYTERNGMYNVTMGTSLNADLNERVFKHATKEYYIYRIYDEEKDDYFWLFDTKSSGAQSGYGYFTKTTLTSGYWYCGETASSTIALSLARNEEDFPAQELVLEGVEATYLNGAWRFGGATTLTGFDKLPIRNGIYIKNKTNIVGFPLDYKTDKNIPTDGLLCYYPLDGARVVDVINGTSIDVHTSEVVAGDGCWQSWSDRSQHLTGLQSDFELPDTFTLYAEIYVHPLGYKVQNSNVLDFGSVPSTGFGIRANTYADGSASCSLRIRDYEPHDNIMIETGAWYSIAFTRTPTETLYGDYYLRGYCNGTLVYAPKFSTDFAGLMTDSPIVCFFGRNFWEGISVSFSGKLRNVILWNRVLTDEEIGSLTTVG